LQDLEKPDDIEDIDGEGEADWEDPKTVPECLSSHLKTCLYSNYRGDKCEFQFTQYVMRNSKVLSKMTIQSACSIDLNAKYQMLQKLSVSPRSCELTFE
jgi:predicted oxidoreductase